ncbi:hypothetical protein Taro_001162 [Colocasia esculenta]|uniref:Uncharacterized protein n=1 Tax=Colocasia esculenta TaxID=4460 RepID=A0A843TF57_COLES|nr:hypothetical protein [Colocasia esculenta]
MVGWFASLLAPYVLSQMVVCCGLEVLVAVWHVALSACVALSFPPLGHFLLARALWLYCYCCWVAALPYLVEPSFCGGVVVVTTRKSWYDLVVPLHLLLFSNRGDLSGCRGVPGGCVLVAVCRGVVLSDRVPVLMRCPVVTGCLSRLPFLLRWYRDRLGGCDCTRLASGWLAGFNDRRAMVSILPSGVPASQAVPCWLPRLFSFARCSALEGLSRSEVVSVSWDPHPREPVEGVLRAMSVLELTA